MNKSRFRCLYYSQELITINIEFKICTDLSFYVLYLFQLFIIDLIACTTNRKFLGLCTYLCW